MSNDELIAEIADAHKAVSRMIIDGTLAGWTDSAHAAHRDRGTLLRMHDETAAEIGNLKAMIAEDRRTCGQSIIEITNAAAAREARLREALEWIVRQEPATQDYTLVSDICERARAALAPGVKP
jgi:hypothetical protein